MIIDTPTFRASLKFVRQAELGDEEVVRRLDADAVAMHKEIRDGSTYGPVYIAGVIGPSGDAHLPEKALGAAMGETGLPNVVSFVLERDGRVLDGTLLHDVSSG